MKSIALIITILLFLTIPALAQENETTDLCADVACSDSTLTCPDGFAASCPNTCNPDTGACSSCEPDCTGHEAPVCGDSVCEEGEETSCPEDCMPAPCMVECPPYSEKTCPDGYIVACSNTLDSGACECQYCEPDCTGHDTPGECIREGGLYDREGDKQCCAGLRPISASVGDGRICSLTAGYYCSPCGNGECTGGENPCSCPEDCPCPEGQTAPFFCSDQVTRVPWGKCLNGKWVYTQSPESQCPISVCGNEICEPGETWDKAWCEADCPPVPPSCICTEEHDPVCGADGRTYPNPCEAKCTGRVNIECGGACPCFPVCGDGICADIERTEQYACREDCPCQCPIEDDPVCGADGRTYPNPCEAMKCGGVSVACSGACPCPAPVCGDGFCGYREECPADCCPVGDVCPDGVTRPCRLADSGCICEPCSLPPGCREERNLQGFIYVVCDGPDIVCPLIPREWEQKCIANDGRPVRRIGPPPGSCLLTDCIFKDTPTDPITPIGCPTWEEINEVFAKCAEAGQEGVIVFKGGCKIAKCEYDPEPPPCPLITYRQEEEDLKDKCFEMGLEVIGDFDPSGCPFLRCGKPGRLREIPREAREKCREMGGEFIERRDEFGYIVFHECIRPGEHEIRIEPIRRVPDVTELLEIAFKLENLRIELNELGRKIDSIADYYQSTGSPEVERFRRIADMAYSAMENIDEIKAKLREMLDSITISDLTNIKHDVIYIKDVMLRDILYLMLSTGDDATGIVSGDIKDCGRNEECFDRAFRSCKKVTFSPEGETGPNVEIKGLEGNLCVLFVFMQEGQGPPPGAILGIYPPYEMTCRIPDYSMGVRDPEEGIFPYCEGPMLDIMKQLAEQPGEISGPGGCASEEECKKYCSRPENADECMKFGQKEGYEQRQCSGCLDNGLCDPAECPGCPDCPTEEENEFERAFRKCRGGVYKPPNGGPNIDIFGLEDGLCVMRLFVTEDEPYPRGEVAITQEEWNPPYEMTCRVPDYFMGTEPPEERVFPYCEGSMVELLRETKKVVQGVIDCGMDGGGCFDMAFRKCRPAMFNPGGSGSLVRIKGLEGDKCILHQVAGEHQMLCKVPNYQQGINPPEDNVLPYCEGSLVAIIIEAGPQPV